MEPASWSKDQRFKRLGEDTDGVVAVGGYGQVYKGYDALTQKMVCIKRQDIKGPSVCRESACYNMLESFPRPNLLKMMGMWIGTCEEKSYLYIAMEACCTTLWKYIGVGNPTKDYHFNPIGGPQKICLAVVRAVGHLHWLGVVHGDVSLSNILIDLSGEPKLADFGTVTEHTYLTPEKLCVAYVRSPETLLGSHQKGIPVDVWAMGIVTLALWTGCVPTSPHFCPHPSGCGDAYCLAEIAKLLPEITDDVWPDQ